MKKIRLKKHHFFVFGKFIFWFSLGNIIGLFFFLSFLFFIFEKIYGEKIYPGVYIGTYYAGGKSQAEVTNHFNTLNQTLSDVNFAFIYKDQIATISATELKAGYNSNLIATQAYSIGRTSYTLSNIANIISSYINGLPLSPSFTFSLEILTNDLSSIIQKAAVVPVNAVFTFQNNKVSAFRLSSNGQQADMDKLSEEISQKIPLLFALPQGKTVVINMPIKILKPQITTEDANRLGIKELIGTGESLFQGSISSRIYNVELAAERLNGILVAPGEIFSFDKALGDVSAFTGYKQAYVIANGHTVLGDGGGVCQVSTTMFRAALNAGLPIVERHGHDYRVEYYEEDGPPGIDATVYVPSVDLKFKNDTGHYILIESVVDPNILKLTFNFYGTSDGRSVRMTTPVVTNQLPPPPPLYTDDPTLPKGTVKQTDFSAWGATVSFSRKVIRNGQIILTDNYVTNYQPWQAVYLRGTGG